MRVGRRVPRGAVLSIALATTSASGHRAKMIHAADETTSKLFQIDLHRKGRRDFTRPGSLAEALRIARTTEMRSAAYQNSTSRPTRIRYPCGAAPAMRSNHDSQCQSGSGSYPKFLHATARSTLSAGDDLSVNGFSTSLVRQFPWNTRRAQATDRLRWRGSVG